MTDELPETGCYVDSHWGQYAIARMVQVAGELGWEDDQAGELAARHLASMGPSTEPGLTGEEHEVLIDCADEAEAWLNEHTARPEGHYWGWNDGDFGLYAEELEL